MIGCRGRAKREEQQEPTTPLHKLAQAPGSPVIVQLHPPAPYNRFRANLGDLLVPLLCCIPAAGRRS
eukprot:656348-Alexandrium_andersonii.AAC.1